MIPFDTIEHQRPAYNNDFLNLTERDLLHLDLVYQTV